MVWLEIENIVPMKEIDFDMQSIRILIIDVRYRPLMYFLKSIDLLLFTFYKLKKNEKELYIP